MKTALQRGFTLIELVIVIAIVGVLATIAYPSYMSSVRQSRRQGAINALNELQLAQERYRANHPSYGTLNNLVSAYGVAGQNGTTPGGYYTLTVTSPSATGYIATATAVPDRSQVNDSAGGASCASLSVNQDQPVDSSSAEALQIQKACWAVETGPDRE